MRRMICLLLTLCLLAACAAAWAEQPSKGQPYANPNLFDSFSERPGPEENYYIYANYDAFVKATTGEGLKAASFAAQAEEQLSDEFLEICTNPEYTDTESEILQILYRLAADKEKRKQETLANLMSRVDRIKAVATTEELTNLMGEEGFLTVTPFFSCVVIKSQLGEDLVVASTNKRVQLEYLSVPDDATEEEQMKGPQLDTETPRKGLLLMQYTEEEADRIISGIEQYDNTFAMTPADWVDGPLVSLEQIRENCAPLYAELCGTGYIKEGAETQKVYEVNADDIASFTEFYTDENLEILKGIAAVALYRYAMEYLDLKEFTEGTDAVMEQFAKERLIRDVRFNADIPANQAFITHYCPEEKWAIAENMFEAIREAMRERIRESAWLSEESQKKALEKLDNLALGQIVPPGGNFNCEQLLADLRDCDTLMDAVAYSTRFGHQCRMRFAGEPMDRTNPYVNNTKGILALGGEYIPELNIFNIGAAALNGYLCDDTSTETLYGTLGYHIGHELSHGYDSLGAQRDVTGTGPLFTEEDSKYFSEQSMKIADQLSKIETGNGVMLPGNEVVYEAMADLTGMTLVLDLAKQKEDFNYETFFMTTAKFFCDYVPGDDNHTQPGVPVDPHPPYYVRVNFTAAHFDKFYEIYPSVTEGTPMYIAPEDRILAW